MTTLNQPVQERLEDLCRAILAQPEFEQHRLHVDQFMINDDARSQYVRVSEQGEHLHHKQTQGLELSQEEIAEFETEREGLLKNPIARGFLDAQAAMQGVQESINRFIGKALELGRVPQGEDLQGGCGNGCGCHHEH